MLKERQLACSTCKQEHRDDDMPLAYVHPLDLRVNSTLDSIVRQLHPKHYLRILQLQQEDERKFKLREQLE